MINKLKICKNLTNIENKEYYNIERNYNQTKKTYKGRDKHRWVEQEEERKKIN